MPSVNFDFENAELIDILLEYYGLGYTVVYMLYEKIISDEIRKTLVKLMPNADIVYIQLDKLSKANCIELPDNCILVLWDSLTHDVECVNSLAYNENNICIEYCNYIVDKHDKNLNNAVITISISGTEYLIDYQSILKCFKHLGIFPCDDIRRNTLLMITALVERFIEARPFRCPTSLFSKKNIINEISKPSLNMEPTSVFIANEKVEGYTRFSKLLRNDISNVSYISTHYSDLYSLASLDDYKKIEIYNPTHLTQTIDISKWPQQVRNKIKLFGFDSSSNTAIEHDALPAYNSHMTIKAIEKPIIAVVSFGCNSMKLRTQLEIYMKLNDMGMHTWCASYNAIGKIFCIEKLEYPQRILLPDYIYQLNNYMDIKINNENTDVAVLNIGGGLCCVNDFAHYYFGMLHDCFFKAVRIDYIIVCVNNGLGIESICRRIKELRATGIPNVVVVVTDLMYSEIMGNSYHPEYVMSSKRVSKITSNEIQKQLLEDGIKVFLFSDVINGILCDDIVKQLS